MRGEGGPAELARLNRCWRRWTAVVEAVARRRGARPRVQPAEYERLRREVLRACQALAAAAGEAGQGPYRCLEGLVEPWLALDVLRRADPEVLFDLLRRCRQAEQALGGRGWLSGAGDRAVPLVKCGAAAAVLAAAGWAAGRAAPAGLAGARERLDPVWLAVRYAGQTPWLLAGGVALTLLAIYLVSRAARD